MMQLSITLDIADYARRVLAVRAEVQAEPGEHRFSLSALAEGNGISVGGWRVAGAESRAEGPLVTVSGASFSLSYEVGVRHEVCLGSGRHNDIVYPFINGREVFFGTGVLPVPQEACAAGFRLRGLPEGWSEFSSLTPGGMHAEKLAAFFCYCAPAAAPAVHTWRGRDRAVRFRALQQRGGPLPVPERGLFAFIDGYLDWLERSLAPYRRAAEINILLLQAPRELAALAAGRTFATGENMLNGIACYAPSDAAYLKENYGCAGYAQFLYEGLAHELLHFYTAGVPDCREKTVLYPAADCPAYAARLLGEALNLYFCSQYVSEHVPEARSAFGRWLGRAGDLRKSTGRRQPLLDLAELDACLRASGSSLLALFRELVLSRLDDRRPYSGAGFLFDTMRSRLNIAPPPELEAAVLNEK